MNSIIEKQILEWKEELAKQVQKRDQANKVADEANRAILMIEGGIQFGESLLKQIEEATPKSGTVELGQQSRKVPSKSKA